MVWRFIGVIGVLVVSMFGLTAYASAQNQAGRLFTVYDRGETKVFLSEEKTIAEALQSQGIELDKRDAVEPLLTEELVASEYHVNIYRARPVTVVDGSVRLKTISAFQTAKEIAKDVGVTVYDEDTTALRASTDYLGDGAGLQLTITRATSVILDLYGRKTEVRTQQKTVGDVLDEKGITLDADSRLALPKSTLITNGLEIRIWKEGKQTVTIDQPIPVTTKLVYDADRPLGYRAVQSPGIPGNRSVTYELEIKDGVEISRIEIATLVTQLPGEQTEVIGLRNDGGGLTLSKGAQYFTDSKGVSHRETYYDLNMSVVMQSCGQGGQYSVRPDGAKVDAQGYIIIAASYANYPKCSVVETSLGPGKVYDTGGFAAKHPFGFDLATDWSRADGI
jgi:uncharacterized protein YabE (DUF348 family)